MERKNRSLLIILIALVVLLCIVIIAFWDSILYLVAPKFVLNQALDSALTQLEDRFRNNPLGILENTLDPEGRYTAKMHLENENKLVGAVTYDMSVQTDGLGHRVLAAGEIGMPSRILDLCLYMDEEFMAVSSDKLVNGDYYGLAYDTFAEDIREIPLLGSVVPGDMLEKWDQSLQAIQQRMGKNYVLPRIPDISQREFRTLLRLVTALPCRIESAAINVGGETYRCRRFTYQASGEVLKLLVSSFSDGKNQKDTAVEVSLYLAEQALIRIEVSCESGKSNYRYKLDLGERPVSNTLVFQAVQRIEGQTDTLDVTVSTRPGEDIYYEEWAIHRSAENSDTASQFSYEWESGSGTMRLRSPKSSVVLVLLKTEDGFRIKTDDFGTLLKVLLQDDEKPLDLIAVRADVTVTRGSDIRTPNYRNISQWSLMDFLELAGGIGALFGIKL